MKNVLGVSVGTRHLRVCAIYNHELSDFVSVDLPENAVSNDAITAWSAIGDILKKLRKERHFKTKNCAVVLPDSGAYVRRTTMPVMTEKQLLVNLPYEFRDVLQDDADRYLFDYSMIDVTNDEEGKPHEMDLIAAITSKDLIGHYTQLFEDAGLKLVKATPRVMAIADLVNALDTGADGHDAAILELGSTFTRIDFFHNGLYEVTRSIDQGVNDIVSAAADVLNCDPHIARSYMHADKDQVLENPSLRNVYNSIAIEIMRALNYYTYENRDNTLDSLYYCGSGSEIAPLIQEIADNVSLKILPLKNADPAAGDTLMKCPACLGVALGD